MIYVNNLNYRAGDQFILKNIDLYAYPGELLAIIGPNGAGKSTLLKLMCKELSCQRGCVFVNNKDICEYSSLQMAKIRSVLPQSNHLSVDFINREIVLMGRYPHYRNVPSDLDHAIVEESLNEMGIRHLADRKYFNLSGGEQQRVQLARVLAQIHENPNAILFLDEPINGLDLKYQKVILQTARRSAERGLTVICILHDINFASKYADKILILKSGEKVAYGQPRQIISEENIYNTYQTKVRLIEDNNLDYPLIVPLD